MPGSAHRQACLAVKKANRGGNTLTVMSVHLEFQTPFWYDWNRARDTVGYRLFPSTTELLRLSFDLDSTLDLSKHLMLHDQVRVGIREP